LAKAGREGVVCSSEFNFTKLPWLHQHTITHTALCEPRT